MILEFELDIPPLASPRPRFAKKGKYVQTYMPTHYTEHKEHVARLVTSMLPDDFEITRNGIDMRIVFIMPIPKSFSKKKRAEVIDKGHIMKPDLDNLIKTYKDALEGIIYNNDSQICCVEAIKMYGEVPKVVIEMEFD